MLANYPIYATLPATDLERAKRFYTEKLGLTAESEAPEGVFYRSGDTHFLVFPSVNLRTAVAKDKRIDKEENATALGGRIFDLDI